MSAGAVNHGDPLSHPLLPDPFAGADRRWIDPMGSDKTICRNSPKDNRYGDCTDATPGPQRTNVFAFGPVQGDCGNEIDFTESLSTRPPGYEINEQVIVLYDPQDHQRARISKKTWRLYYYALLFGGLGIIFVVVYVLVLIPLYSGRY